MYEYLLRKSDDKFMRRCKECWRGRAVRTVNGWQPPVDNGFVDVNKDYPHARWCSVVSKEG